MPNWRHRQIGLHAQRSFRRAAYRSPPVARHAFRVTYQQQARHASIGARRADAG